jgi:hypothetical protein
MQHPRSLNKVNASVRQTAKKHGIRIYEYANVGNQMHLLLKLSSIPGWRAFIRELTGRISQIVQGTHKEKGFKYFSQRPFTRIIRGWRRAYKVAKDYVLLNHLKGEGLISRLDKRLRMAVDST